MFRGRKRKPIYDELGHPIGEIERGDSPDHQRRGGFSRILIALLVAFGIGYALNTPVGRQWVEVGLKWLSSAQAGALPQPSR